MEKRGTDKSNEPKLRFKAITDGLGFHPFSDGLPYAPVSQSGNTAAPVVQAPISTNKVSQASAARGAGAVSAGQPQYAPRVQVPTASPKIPTRPASIGTPTGPRIAPSATLGKPVVQTVSPAAAASQIKSVDPAYTYGLGYVLRRVFAFFLDVALNTSLCLAALSFVLVNQDVSPDTLVSPGVVTLFSVFLIAFNWALITAQEVAFGTSLGKRVFRLVIQGSPVATFLRAFFFLPSVAFCGAGLLWALLNRRKRCWHDSIVDLQPIVLAKL